MLGTWLSKALCAKREHIAADFYIEDVGGAYPHALRTVQAICLECPVKVQCATHAVQNPEVGIWGATTHRDRAVLAGSRNLPAAIRKHHRRLEQLAKARTR